MEKSPTIEPIDEVKGPQRQRYVRNNRETIGAISVTAATAIAVIWAITADKIEHYAIEDIKDAEALLLDSRTGIAESLAANNCRISQSELSRSSSETLANNPRVRNVDIDQDVLCPHGDSEVLAANLKMERVGGLDKSFSLQMRDTDFGPANNLYNFERTNDARGFVKTIRWEFQDGESVTCTAQEPDEDGLYPRLNTDSLDCVVHGFVLDTSFWGELSPEGFGVRSERKN